jgi:hypothetical protein
MNLNKNVRKEYTKMKENKFPELMSPRYFILGFGRAGKDSVAEMLVKKLNYNMAASSWICANEFIFDRLKNTFGYKTVDECFRDRHRNQEMRDLWHNLIFEYNQNDLTRLSKLIFKHNNIYVGIRKDVELLAAQEIGLADHYIWVEAGDRIEPEPITSMNVTKDMADYVLDNTGPEEHLEAMVDMMINDLNLQPM